MATISVFLPGEFHRQRSLAGYSLQFSSVHFSCSVVSDSLRPHELQHTKPSCPSPTPRSHPKPMSIVSVMQSNHLIFCHPLLLLPSIFPSVGVFSNESQGIVYSGDGDGLRGVPVSIGEGQGRSRYRGLPCICRSDGQDHVR